MKTTFLKLVAAVLGVAGAVMAEDLPEMDIVTKNGERFPDAVIERIGKTRVDFGYIKANGEYVVKGLELDDLTPELQQRLGYDPLEAAIYRQRLAERRKADLQAEIKKAKLRVEQTAAKIRADFVSGNFDIKSEDLGIVVEAKRRPVSVLALSEGKTGTVVKVVRDDSGEPALPERILIDDVWLDTDGGAWSGFIYPTGINTKVNGVDTPVFCESLEAAVALIQHYLAIYADYYAQNGNNGQSGSGVSAPDQTGQSETSSGESAISYGGYGYYYIGGDYWPIYWWNRRYPPRPHRWPPRPPRPPFWPRPPSPAPSDPDSPQRPHPSGGSSGIALPQPVQPPLERVKPKWQPGAPLRPAPYTPAPGSGWGAPEASSSDTVKVDGTSGLSVKAGAGWGAGDNRSSQVSGSQSGMSVKPGSGWGAGTRGITPRMIERRGGFGRTPAFVRGGIRGGR